MSQSRSSDSTIIPSKPLDMSSVGFSHSIQKWIYVCFFFSGMDALIYEIAWLNRIQLIMGHTIYSLATTLSAYMSGLALGALFVPRLKKSGINSLALYLIAELLIGIYGLLFYPLLKLTQIPYDYLVTHFQFSLLSLSLIQFVFCTSLIIIPTFLMGTTLPLIGPYLYPEKNEISEKLPTLYAFNTLGAMVGSIAAGYFILPILGYSKTSRLAAGINIGLYFAMVLIAEYRSNQSSISDQFKLSTFKKLFQAIFTKANDTSSQKNLVSGNPWILTVLFISGFASMLSQVIWGRLASMSFGPSVYIFPLVTTVVLGGITLGSWLWRKVSDQPIIANRVFVLLPLFTAIAFMIGNFAFSHSPRLVLVWNQTISPRFFLRTIFELTWTSICLLPAATLLGALFPAATTQLTRDQTAEQATRSLGIGYALNIAGLILGAILGSFLLIPELGIENMAIGLSILLFILSAALTYDQSRLFQTATACLALGLVFVSVIPSFDWNLLCSGYFYNRTKKMTSEALHELGWTQHVNYFRSFVAPLLVKKDDPHATISIHQGRIDKNYLNFKVNGKVDGTNSSDLKTTRLLSTFPALMKPDAKSTLIIGLGTGSSAAQALKFPEMQKVKVIELSSAMIDFAKTYFSKVDGDIWNDSRFSIDHRDGRDYLDHTKDKYDIIMSEPSNPWVDGVASLFTQEFYESVSKRLNPNGVASLWFHTYGLDCQAVQSVLAAVARVFPSVLVFNKGGDLFILASPELNGLIPQVLPASAGEVERVLFEESGIYLSGYFQDNKVSSYRELLEKTLLYDRDTVLNVTKLAPVNRDDNQFLQYRSGKTYSMDIDCHDFLGSGGRDLFEKYGFNFIKKF